MRKPTENNVVGATVDGTFATATIAATTNSNKLAGFFNNAKQQPATARPRAGTYILVVNDVLVCVCVCVFSCMVALFVIKAVNQEFRNCVAGGTSDGRDSDK